MSSPSQSNPMGSLVQELAGQLSTAACGDGRRSLGVVGRTLTPQPPAHCLRTCLAGDPRQLGQRGCPWLRAAGTGNHLPELLNDGKCRHGFTATAQPIRLNGSGALLLAVAEAGGGVCPGSDASAPEAALQHLESLSRALERVGQLLDENEGLAEEVLRSYEQLNLIFDFTQQIVRFTDVGEIETTLLGRLADLLRARAVVVIGADGNFRFCDPSRGAAAADPEMMTLLDELAGQLQTLQRSRTLAVRSTSTARLLLGPLVRLDDKVETVLAVRSLDAGEFTSGDMLMIESLLTFGGQIISNAEVHERLRRMSLESTRALVAAIDKKDHYTSGHSERVGLLARLIGRRLDFPADKLQVLEMSGLLHDVGKIGIPESILCKPGKLTAGEYDVIQKHPRMGWEILKPIASFREVLEGVLFHHENPDGSGYPDGLCGEAIPLFARIIHVVDVFDALTSTRSYRVRYSPEQACKILRRESGNRLDADIAAVFLAALPEFHQGHSEAFAGAVPEDELSHVPS